MTRLNSNRRPLRHNPLPEAMFLGGVGRFFGKVGKGIFEGAKGVADLGLSAAGFGSVIDNSFVDKNKFLTGLTNFTGSALPIAANFIPGLGPMAAAGISAAQGLGRNTFGNDAGVVSGGRGIQPQYGNPMGGGFGGYGYPPMGGGFTTPTGSSGGMGSIFGSLSAFLPSIMQMTNMLSGVDNDRGKGRTLQAPAQIASGFDINSLLGNGSRTGQLPFGNAFGTRFGFQDGGGATRRSFGVGAKDYKEPMSPSAELLASLFRDEHTQDTIKRNKIIDLLKRKDVRAEAELLNMYKNENREDVEMFFEENPNAKFRDYFKWFYETDSISDDSPYNPEYFKLIDEEAKYTSKNLDKAKRGGKIKKYQTGGLVDIQAERDELVLHPTGALTDVHAKKLHSALGKKGEDIVTDHPLEGSFIFSDFLKLRKSDADDLVVGVKRHPYDENKKGREPEIYSVGDLFKKGERKRTPAQLARRVKETFKVTGDKTDMFNILGDGFNEKNRAPYLDGIAMLSEVERFKDDMLDQIKDMSSLPIAKKGGRMKSRWVRKYQTQGPVMPVPEIPTIRAQAPSQYPFNPALPLPTSVQSMFPFTPPNIPRLPLPQAPSIPSGYDINPLPSSIQSQNPSTAYDMYNNGVAPTIPDSMLTPDAQFLRQMGQQMNGQGNTLTQFMNVGSPLLRGFGEAGMLAGGIGNTLTNMGAALGAYNLNNNLLNENPAFFQGREDLINQSRDIASQGNLFDVGLGLARQGPEDLPTRFSSRLRQFDPFRQVDVSRQLADQSIGQVNSIVRNNPNIRGLNIGDSIARSNQGIAQSTQNALNQQLGMFRELDNEDFYNDQIRAQNRQRRVDFGNSLMDDARGGFRSLFTNEASRPLDILGSRDVQRQSDIALRQARLREPISYLSTAFNSLGNTGATAYSLGNQFIPVQTSANGGTGSGFFNIQNINSALELARNLGLKMRKGGRVRKRKRY